MKVLRIKVNKTLGAREALVVSLASYRIYFSVEGPALTHLNRLEERIILMQAVFSIGETYSSCQMFYV